MRLLQIKLRETVQICAVAWLRYSSGTRNQQL